MALPKYWILQWEDTKEFQEFIELVNKEYNKDFSGCSSSRACWYGYDGEDSFTLRGNRYFHCYEKTSSFKNNPVVFNSAKEFFEALNEEEYSLPKKWKLRIARENAELIDSHRETLEYYDCTLSATYKDAINGWYISDSSYSGNMCWGPNVELKDYKEITFEQFKKYVLKEQEEKIYTIEDLAEGRVQLEFNGENIYLLHTIIRKAFPKDGIPPQGINKYYYKLMEGKWTASDSSCNNLPIQHISKFKLTPKEMNYTISKVQLKEIHDIACSTWKAKIKEYASQDPFADNITFSEKQVKEMFNAATKEQLPTLKSIFKDYQKEETLDDIKDWRNHFGQENMLWVRSSCEYANKGYYLNDDFNWEIKIDSNNARVLIPTRK